MPSKPSTPHSPIKPSLLSQPTLSPKIPDRDDRDPPPDNRKDGFRWFFHMDNPLWSMVPILLSVAALWFAYKSNVINREWADVHLMVTNQAWMGYYMGEDYFVHDDGTYIPSIIGSMDKIDEILGLGTIAYNEIQMQWMADAWGFDLDEANAEDMNYLKYFLYLAVSNDGDQIADELYVDFEYYRVDDQEEIRGDNSVPEGIEPVDWIFGPSILAPDQWIMIPLGACYIRLDPSAQEPDVRYIGDFYLPIEMRYSSAVSGEHSKELDFETIPTVSFSFTEPPYEEEDTPTSSQAGSDKQ